MARKAIIKLHSDVVMVDYVRNNIIVGSIWRFAFTEIKAIGDYAFNDYEAVDILYADGHVESVESRR